MTIKKGLAEAGRQRSESSLVGEMWAFLAVTKKWWLLPIVLVFGLLGVLIMLSGSAAAPFIYTLF